MVSFPFYFCRNLAILYIPPSRGGYIIFWVGIVVLLFILSLSFSFPFYLPSAAGTAASTSHEYNRHQPAANTHPAGTDTTAPHPAGTTPASQYTTTSQHNSRDDTQHDTTKQGQTQHQSTPAPHKYPFICRITAYYSLSSLLYQP